MSYCMSNSHSSEDFTGSGPTMIVGQGTCRTDAEKPRHGEDGYHFFHILPFPLSTFAAFDWLRLSFIRHSCKKIHTEMLSSTP
jgi:hypothetical protein